MPSANLDEATKTAVKARVVNNGQSCIAAKRFFVAESIAENFTAQFVASMKALRVGDPMLPTTEIGPLSTPQMVADLEKQVGELVKSGARILAGGKRISGPGNFFEPTVVANINPSSPAYYEELFGPVAMLFVVRDANEAIQMANDSPFGLGASAWTNDPAEQALFINELQAGMVFINGMVASDPRLPFGGVKQSGYGRELGVFGIREFVNAKTVWINGHGAGESATTD
jgi:succinate-semialdehyde dehydrogenase/glutarate-semialdehyde dehydrogenase